jgi:hypothetical protein
MNDDARFPALASAGAAVLRLLAQVEERLARHPRAARDPAFETALDGIRREARELAELYEYVTRPGLCCHCGQVDARLVAALSADPGQEVCEACALDPDVAAFPLSALADDREVWTVTRGDLAWLAGREVTDGEAVRLAAVIGDRTAGTVARLVEEVCGSAPLPA